MLKVYTASKLKHAQMWKELCSKHNHFIFHARWLKHVTLGTEDSPENARFFWEQDEDDVKNADALLVYAAPDDHLRGGLVEVGIALASKTPVIAIGKHPDYGTWQYHPGVYRVESIEHALKLLERIKHRYHRQT